MLGRADQGIMIPTSGFSHAAAMQESNRAATAPIEPVDADQLIEMFHRVELAVIRRTIHGVDPASYGRFKHG